MFDEHFADLKPDPAVRIADFVVSDVGGGPAPDVGTIIKRFKEEPFPQILVSVNMLDTGFDCPEVVNLVMARFTRSTILYRQMRGRGTRKAEHIGKTGFTIFDFVGVDGLPRGRRGGHPRRRDGPEGRFSIRPRSAHAADARCGRPHRSLDPRVADARRARPDRAHARTRGAGRRDRFARRGLARNAGVHGRAGTLGRPHRTPGHGRRDARGTVSGTTIWTSIPSTPWAATIRRGGCSAGVDALGDLISGFNAQVLGAAGASGSPIGGGDAR